MTTKAAAMAGVIPVSEAKKLAVAAEKDATEWTWTKAWAFAHREMANTAWEAMRQAARNSAESWSAFKEAALERAAEARAAGNSHEGDVWAGAAKGGAELSAKAQAVWAAGNPFS